MPAFTWRHRFVVVVVREPGAGGEGTSEEVTAVRFGVTETLTVLRVVLHLVPLAAGQITALCERRTGTWTWRTQGTDLQTQYLLAG